MKKVLSLVLVGVLAAAMLAGCGGKSGAGKKSEWDGTTLNLYTWEEMFPQEILDGFTEKYGVKISYTNFEYDEDMLAKLEETDGGDYDVVIADDYILELVNQEGLAMELDKDQIPNWKNIDERYLGMFYDPEDKYDAPYGCGVPLILYDPTLTDVEIKGFGDLWDPALENNVALTANYRVIDGFTLMTLGESMNTEDIAKIEEAGEKLLALAPNVRAIIDDNTQDLLLSGEVAAAFLYTSQVTKALQANPDLKVVYPEEGLGFGTMCMFVPSKAPNAGAAHAFINYILDSENSAKCFEYMGYYSTTATAEEFMSEEGKEFYILPEGTADGEAVSLISDEANEAHEKIWAAFQSACGAS